MANFNINNNIGFRQSLLFSKTRKEAPKDEVSKNASLLIKAGFINKEMAGVYSYLPLGLRVLNNINDIIRDEMNKAGGQELFLTVLQEKASWEKTGRWSSEVVDNWFKTKLNSGTELGLGFTHEEALTSLMKDHIRSYKDLPVYPYQIQTKFRNEARAKSGIMRCREFLMKDLYSFSRDKDEHDTFYQKMKVSYTNIFDRIGLGKTTYFTFASGGSFSKYSHEFQTLSDAGEDNIYCCDRCLVAVNEEVLADQKVCPQCGNEGLVARKAVEVGNIFTLGTRFSDPLELKFIDAAGEKKPVFMGSYGIGPGRVMGTVVEVLSDDKGIVWPKSIAPYSVHLIEVSSISGEVKMQCEKIFNDLIKAGISVLYDDRDQRAGEKFNDADLIGIPTRIVIGEKGLKNGTVEYKDRKSGETQDMKIDNVVEMLQKDK